MGPAPVSPRRDGRVASVPDPARVPPQRLRAPRARNIGRGLVLPERLNLRRWPQRLASALPAAPSPRRSNLDPRLDTGDEDVGEVPALRASFEAADREHPGADVEIDRHVSAVRAAREVPELSHGFIVANGGPDLTLRSFRPTRPRGSTGYGHPVTSLHVKELRDSLRARLTEIDAELATFDALRDERGRIAAAIDALESDAVTEPASVTTRKASASKSRRGRGRASAPGKKQEAIITFLAGNPGSSASAVADAVGLKRNSTSTRLSQLAKDGVIVKSAGRGYELPVAAAEG